MKKRIALGMLVSLIFSIVVGSCIGQAQASDQTVSLGSTGQRVIEVQYILKSFGYAVPITGKFETKTQKAVVHFQKVSRLRPDGVVGPKTWDVLNGAATANQQAVRVTPPAPAPLIVPQRWVKYDCDSFKYLFDQYGLPWDFFRPVIKRESHCDPNAYCDRYSDCRSKTDRSYGLGQINMLGSLGPYRMQLCRLSQESDLFDPETNVACIAELYRLAGRSPWS